MKAHRSTVAGLCIGIGLAASALIWATLPAQGQQKPLPMEPAHESGQGITGAFEGWVKNPDGTFSILVGYFNRNLKEELDIPIGPDNRIDPGGPDQGQPTHFMPRRQWGVFVVKVPKDFVGKRLTWTLTANHQTNAIPLDVDPLWEIEPFSEIGMGNTPPVLRFDEGGPTVQGPVSGSIKSLTATAGEPIPLTLEAADDAKTFPGAKPPRLPAVSVTWAKFRGPGTVTFSLAKPPVEKADVKGLTAPFTGKAATTATFSEPGEYTLLAIGNDWSGDGGRGFQCCWTTAQVKVSVKAK